MMKFRPVLPLFIFFLLLAIPGNTAAQMRPILKNRVGVPPFEVVKNILETNLRPGSPPRLADAKIANQTPYITWLADTDARVEPHLILPAASGLIYSVRNMGNQLVTAHGAVDYGVLHLHTPVLLITGNTDSEALDILLNHQNVLPTATQTDLDHLFLPVRAAAAPKYQELPPLKKAQLLLEKNIDHQVEMSMQRYDERIRAHRLVVIGAILDITNQYGKGANRLLIININGEQRDTALLTMPLTDNLRPELKKALGRTPAAPGTRQ